MEHYRPDVPYHKWSVPADLAEQIINACGRLGYTKRGERWKLIGFLLDYAAAHPDLFRNRK